MGRRGQLRAVVGNVTLSGNAVIAWYLLEPRSVSFRPDAEVEEMIRSGAAALANLTGMRTFWRVTARPYAVREMAEATWADAVRAGHPLPGATDMLVREQQYLQGSDLSEKYVFIGVRVATKRRHASDPRREVAELSERIEKVTAVVASAGLEGDPANADEMDLLLRRSIGLGLPAPRTHTYLTGDYDESDLPTLTAEVNITAEPFAKAVRVQGWTPTGEPIERWVAVLTMGRVGAMEVPQDGSGGWMHRTDRLPFEVEWMATCDVLPDERVNREVRKQLDKVQDQHKHYEVEHGKPAPKALARQYGQAIQVEDELNVGMGGLATRTDGWYRVAVWGDTEQEVRDRVAQLTALYGRQVEWWWSTGQFNLVREFTPCEPLANEAARRRFPVTSVLAALPAATAAVGDNYGCVMGSTSGTSRRPVVWHMWLDMETRHRSGLTVLTGGLGSGKSNAGGLVVYRTAMLGARWTVFDPSGRLGKLCELPELRDHAVHTNLMAGRSGELSPYRVIADPDPRHFHDPRRSRIENEAEWREEMGQARARRSSLCRDTLLQLMPQGLRKRQATTSVLGTAVSRVPGEVTSTAGMVLDQLRAIATNDYSTVGEGYRAQDEFLPGEYRVTARDVLTELEMFAAEPKGRLIFGTPDPAAPGGPDQVVLTVYSMHGLRIPTARQLEQGDESSDARQSLVLFNLAAWLAQQSIYQGDPNERKGLFIDEAHMLAFEEGQNLIEKSSVDSRKHNARVILCSQNVSHFEVEAISNLAGSVLIGRTTAAGAARDALKLAGLAQSDGYVRLLAGLTRSGRRARRSAAPTRRTPHEFVFSTLDLGTVEKLGIDGWAHPHVMEALDTSADPTKTRRDDDEYDEYDEPESDEPPPAAQDQHDDVHEERVSDEVA